MIPATTIGWNDRIGSLSVGRAADISVLQVVKLGVDGTPKLDLEDCQGQKRAMSQYLRCIACWKDGEACQITRPKAFPNQVRWKHRGRVGGSTSFSSLPVCVLCRVTSVLVCAYRMLQSSKSSADPSKLVVSDTVRRILARKKPPRSNDGGDGKRTCC